MTLPCSEHRRPAGAALPFDRLRAPRVHRAGNGPRYAGLKTALARVALAGSAAMFVTGGCRSSEPPRPPQAVVAWKPVGSWQGRGNAQTGVFTSDSGGFRVHWEMKNESRPDAGRLRVIFSSGDSGRDIIEAIDARGAGSGLEEVAAERPRWYYLTIESADADWKVSVDERIDGQARD